MSTAAFSLVDDLNVPATYRCRVTHQRTDRVRHKFRHTMILWLVDVDQIPQHPLTRRARFSASDHLGDPTAGIGDNIRLFLAEHGIGDIGRVLMLAQPCTITGYAFDPVSFFYCYRTDGRLDRIIAEVRNTFGERHCYLLDPSSPGGGIVDKGLYVSPYFPTDGHYRMRFTLTPQRLRATITLHRPIRGGTAGHPATAPAIAAVLTGHRMSRITAIVASSVLSARRTILLIHWQALRLRRAGLTAARRQYHQPQPAVDAPPVALRSDGATS